MTNSGTTKDDAARPQLIYPFDTPPARGEVVEVVSGVLWIRMPLPFVLSHINVWAVDDGAGWAIVDSGIQMAETADAWRERRSRNPERLCGARLGAQDR
jgi:hypothetical protein